MAKRRTDNAGMTKAGDNDAKPDKKGRRSDRLAVALRENLRRRKAQIRQRGAAMAADTRQMADDKPKNS
jgi:hypothetical protein